MWLEKRRWALRHERHQRIVQVRYTRTCTQQSAQPKRGTFTRRWKADGQGREREKKKSPLPGPSRLIRLELADSDTCVETARSLRLLHIFKKICLVLQSTENNCRIHLRPYRHRAIPKVFFCSSFRGSEQGFYFTAPVCGNAEISPHF
jgi:hypothetical protein